MATVYGPMTFGGGGGKTSCVLLRQSEPLGSGKPLLCFAEPQLIASLHHKKTLWFCRAGSLATPALVASGTFHSPDTTRIIAKRVILTGHPFKVHKKTATVRYMFFNPGV